MRGGPLQQVTMLSTVTPDQLIPADHPIRRMKLIVDEARRTTRRVGYQLSPRVRCNTHLGSTTKASRYTSAQAIVLTEEEQRELGAPGSSSQPPRH